MACFSQWWLDDRACAECELATDCRQAAEGGNRPATLTFEDARAEVNA